MCGRTHPEVMHPLPGDAKGIRAAQQVCAPCRVKTQCLKQSFQFQDWGGIRAGYTGLERARYARDGLAVEELPPPRVPVETFHCARCRDEVARDPERPFAKFCSSCAWNPPGGRKPSLCRDCKQQPGKSPGGRCEDCAASPARLFAEVPS